ncbi:MAG: hypothetical protein ACAI25_17865 [Planctomycetota bacterium]
MRKIALLLVMLGGLFVWTGCPENPPAPGTTKPAGGDASAPVGSK